MDLIMPSYEYSCPLHGEKEYQHSIKDSLEECPICQEEKIDPPHKLKRLISLSSFVLAGGGWASSGYKK
jgi:putative FmdB family regulatory protein